MTTPNAFESTPGQSTPRQPTPGQSTLEESILGMGQALKPASSVRVTAGETLALLMHAARNNRAWLNDFAEETIEISHDMYEVLLAYRRLAVENNARAA